MCIGLTVHALLCHLGDVDTPSFPTGLATRLPNRVLRAAQEAPMPKVLVLDDHRDTAESLGMLLSMRGHDVRAVTSGYSAFDVLDDFEPDVCLLDIRMPGMDGYQVAARMRRLLGPGVRVLALTGVLGAAADPRSTVFDRVFTKPPDLGELLDAVAESGR